MLDIVAICLLPQPSGCNRALHGEASHLAQAKATTQLERRGAVVSLAMTVPVPPQQAWAVLTNYTPTFSAMPDVKAVQVHSRQNNTVRLRKVLQAPYTFGLEIQALLQGHEDPTDFSLSYALVRGTHIRELKGQWSLTPIPEGTRVEHSLELIPEVPSILMSTFRTLHDSSLRQSFTTLHQLMLAPSEGIPHRSSSNVTRAINPRALSISAND